MAILIYTETREGKFRKQSFELISYAHSLAQMTGGEVIALSVGEVTDIELKQLGEYGASRIIAIDCNVQIDSRNLSKLIHHWAGVTGANIVLFADNNTGKSLAGVVAARLGAGVLSGVSGLPLSIEPFVLSKMVFTGKAFAQVQINSPQKVMLITNNSFGVHPNSVVPTIEHHSLPAEYATSSTRLINTEMQKGKILLNDAEVVVSGGRGMKGPENWAPLEELAELLNAATACSRPVSDEGWRPHTEHVGQTGKIINPNLYFTFGISGAIQHVAGVSRSRVIVAVNKDPEAAIFSVANYGIVGDAQKILPQLIAAARQLKSNS